MLSLFLPFLPHVYLEVLQDGLVGDALAGLKLGDLILSLFFNPLNL